MPKLKLQFFFRCAAAAVLLAASFSFAQTKTSAPVAAAGTQSPPGYSTAVTGGIRDFDYFAGAWTTHQQALKARNAGSKEWQEFGSVICVTQYLGGMVEVSDMYTPAKGSSGFTVRAFDMKKNQWATHYINAKTGEIGPGMLGGFHGAQGKFYGEDTDNGQPIKAEVKWTEIDHDHARWEQAFSYDNGTWETNWISDFKRADPATVCENGHPKR